MTETMKISHIIVLEQIHFCIHVETYIGLDMNVKVNLFKDYYMANFSDLCRAITTHDFRISIYRESNIMWMYVLRSQ